jgi:hypothetical protein
MKVKINEEVLFQNLEDGAVLLNINTEQYFGLDEVGTSMWNTLNESESVEEAYEKLINEYDVEPAKLHKDLHDLINNLAEYQLLSITT